jgi:hypothetical protein
MAPELADTWKAVMSRSRQYDTIHEFAATMVQLVHYRDPDGRDIGFDYEYIRNAIIARFPIVTVRGPHKGQPTKMPYKELQKITGELNRKGIRLPFRPRRRKTKKEPTA